MIKSLYGVMSIISIITNSSPNQAQFVSQKHAWENQEHYPRATKTILESTFMDDSMDSSPSEEEYVKL